MSVLIEQNQEKLAKTLKDIAKYDDYTCDAIIHALVDIKESTDKIYLELISKLLNVSSDIEKQDVLWEIREEFRHIDYHIHDAGLTD